MEGDVHVQEQGEEDRTSEWGGIDQGNEVVESGGQGGRRRTTRKK